MLTLNDALLGGPGLDGYVYNAAVYCVPCGRALTRSAFIARNNKPLDDIDARDSETVPQPIFFGEADCAQHCDECGEYLYGPEDDS